MPLYTFRCPLCLSSVDEVRSVEERRRPLPCSCGGSRLRIPESFHADIFQPYYDEALDENLYSKSDKKRAMRELGVVEAGDRVGGARNEDKHAPRLVGKRAVRDRKPRARSAPYDPMVQTFDAGDKPVERKRLSELPDR